MDLTGILELFGYSVYDPQIDAMLERCDAACEDKSQLKRYASIESRKLGISFWFWWKEFYRRQIGDPKGTVEPDDSEEVVLYEVRFGPKGLTKAKLPFGLRFGASPEAVTDALGRKPFSKSKNFANEPIWTFYDDKFELLVRFTKDAKKVDAFKIWALKQADREKVQFVESLKEQKKNILPERISDIEASIQQLPTTAWEKRMKSGDEQITSEAIEASREVFAAFIANVSKATKTKNAKSIYTALTKATKAFNKVARQHRGFIETMEREEIVDFLHDTLRLTGFEIDPGFDLTEEYRSW